MRRILLILWPVGLLAASQLFADVVTLTNGRQISGVVEDGNTQVLHINVGDQSQTVEIDQLRAIQFDASPAAPPATPKKAEGRGEQRGVPGAAAPLLALSVCLAAAVWSGRRVSERSRS